MDFYKRARIVCLAIPYGEAATYGQIAMLLRKTEECPAGGSEAVRLEKYSGRSAGVPGDL